MSDVNINPITKTDYPDPDVIRVGDTYYMISTTMHFMPGGVILRSYDLVNWEIANYIFDRLDDSDEERLERELSSYGGGMWAGSLRYHDGKFYAAFVSHFSERTYLFTAKDVCDKWEKSTIEGYYHDCSLLFDDDDRVYIVYGNREIRLVELKKDLSGPKEGGINRVLLTDNNDVILGYEGSHLYKINGKYYLFMIHWPKKAPTRRTEACFVADSLEGDFAGCDVFDDDRDYCNAGVAQGGIVDTPDGRWYSIMFQDSGAVGRMPVLVPIHWENDFPVFGEDGKVPKSFEVVSNRPYYEYEPLFTSDDFKYVTDEKGHAKLKLQWQWNHIPKDELWNINPKGGLNIKTGKLCTNMTHANNCLTQRMAYPKCEGEVTIDASKLKDGDVAGLCALQGCYGYVGITKETGNYYLVVVTKELEPSFKIGASDYLPGKIIEKIKLKESTVTVGLKAVFENRKDTLDFYYVSDGKQVKVGDTHKLQFRLDHFTGARFGLFVFATKEIAGEATFTDFEYRY